MELLVIRHGVAEDRDAFAATGRSDALRPLTPEGIRKMERAARGLARVAPEVSVVASSPLRRAVQTAHIVARALGLDGVEELQALVPDARPEALLGWIAARPRDGAAAVVGHEPHVGKLVAFLVGAGRGSRIAVGKGGACLIRFDGAPSAGGGELRWLLAPAQLRRLRR